MNQWGKHMTSTVEAVAEMAALGCGYPAAVHSDCLTPLQVWVAPDLHLGADAERPTPAGPNR